MDEVEPVRTGTRMEIAFGVLSAHEPQETVKQLVCSLGDRDPIIVHHDYSKQPRFTLAGTRAYLIPDFIETSWGSAALPRAIFHLIRTALKRSHFHYFQLLSASCLPLRPIDELRGHLSAGRHAIYADIINLDSDERAMMSHGHRVFCRTGKHGSRLLNWSRRCYLGNDPVTVQQANLGIVERSRPHAGLTARQWLGKKIHHAARAGLLDTHPFRGDTAPLVGSLWFCLRRDVCEYLVHQEESNPLIPFLMGLKVCDEILFPTILGNSPFASVPSNHLVSDFIGSHPRPFDEGDLQTLARSEKFFARKFEVAPRDRIRQSVLERLECLKHGDSPMRPKHPSALARSLPKWSKEQDDRASDPT
ncbi:MAG: hypothetical protein H0T52_13445 [Lautropia sp.]|nr:hypothetical protein [Lautropia sp.]